ncbi:DUF2442 domain-containing protein [Hydrogenovibrio halophilus]|uniref:DUF2442 domain-containing protein n=1 Tax=Hydrogenovibrio halophilus TaxID=373391 RepID=UPI0003813085|nr:DUF2442 domain-containing protein [Hydrogenovibrio halophilus]
MSLPDEIKVVSADYLGDFALKTHFSDGHHQTVHFKNFIFQHAHSDIQKYKDESAFKNFQISDGDLIWDDYELCFPIADLYENKNIEIPHNKNVA